jgi:hypothetical protein
LVARAHAGQLEAALEFLNGPNQSTLKPVHRVLSLIGSASGCKFRLTDSSVSRFHGSLLQTSAGLWIVDLLGQKGITINDVPVRSSRLVDGDIIRIGRYQIRIRCRAFAQGTGPSLFDFGRAAAFVPKQARQMRAPIDFQSANSVSAITPFHSGLADGRESSPLSIQNFSLPSKIDLVPTDPTLPVKLAQSDLTESLLVPLVSQFGMMQQQMFDQFQQAMAMMVQMFGTMHRDQMEVIRAELDQLRELTEEFHSLKKELAERTQNQAEAISSEPDLNRTVFDQPAGMDSNSSAAPLLAPSAELKRSSETKRINQALVSSSPSGRSKTVGQRHSADPRVEASQPLSSSPKVTSISEPIAQTDSQPSTKSSGASSEPEADRASVLWLHQRIMVLQQERESRWQKILKLVPGMSSP